MTFVSELEPGALWAHFDAILEIPRGSKNEARMREHVVAVAQRNGLDASTDDTGNVVVRVPASPGHESAPIVILQAHLDMVNEKNSDVDHDFEKDPIIPERDGEYLTARGTTLGSDNGIGVAAMLAVMEAEDLTHGPLELLFTIDEETGMTGALGLADGMLEGKLLINMDSEEENVLTVGCAGGADTYLTLPIAKERPADGSVGLALTLRGMKGGHSGIDIHLQRGNANKLLGRAIYTVSRRHPLRLASLEGGNAHNAIPREAHATVVMAASDLSTVQAELEAELGAIAAEFRTPDPDMSFEVSGTDLPADVFSEASTARVLELIAALPHGVLMMSNDMEGLVETSTNLAVVGERDGGFRILLSNRSSVASALVALRERLRAIAALAGAEVTEKAGYPPWQPNMASSLLAILQRIHEPVTGVVPEVGAVHAGLECSIVADKYPGIDMISFGPQIDFPHSPDERVKIDTVATFYRLLEATLGELA
jgi:dipeptidase D